MLALDVELEKLQTVYRHITKQPDEKNMQKQNFMVNQRLFKGVLMITMMITKEDHKGDDKKLKDQSN